MLDRLFKNLPTVTKNLLIINVLFFLLTSILDDNSPITAALAMRFPTSEFFRPWQVITHFFMHASFSHILFNMFALLMFGSQLERVWGPKRFLQFYFICAFGAAGIHTLYTGWKLNDMQNDIASFQNSPSLEGYADYIRENVPTGRLREIASKPGPNQKWAISKLERISNIEEALNSNTSDPGLIEASVQNMAGWRKFNEDGQVLGASGAIYGLLLAFGMLFPNVELMLIFFPIPIKAKFFIPGLIAIELFLGFNNFSWDNTAHFAHLGGALVGFIVVKIWQKRRDSFY